MSVEGRDEALHCLQTCAFRDLAVNLSKFVIDNEASFAFERLAFYGWLVMDNAAVVGPKF